MPLQALLVACLTTLISYQVSAIIIDLSLFRKPRSQAPFSTLLALLLSELCTPLAILSSILPSPALASLAYRHPPPPSPRLPDEVSRAPHPKILLTLLLFLLAPPLSNLLSLVITLDHEKILSFSDTRFGGLALGLNASQPSLGIVPATLLCSQYVLTLLPNDWPLASFFQCTRVAGATASESATSFVAARVRTDAILEFELDLRPVYVRSETFLEMRMEGEEAMWRVGVSAREEDLKLIVEYGVKEVIGACGGSAIGSVEVVNKEGGELEVRQQVPFCRAGEVNEVGLAGRIVAGALENVTLVEGGGEFQVGKVSKDGKVENFANGQALDLVRRRQSLMGASGLAVMAAILLIVRLVVGAAVGNDLYVGVELIVKDVVGGKCCDGLLQRADVVNYFGEGIAERRDKE